VTVLWTPPNCNLPSLPDAITWGGVPQYDADGKETGWILITHDGLGELGGYLVGVAQWAEAAQKCLEAQK
jgi:hypothetical protein